MGIHKLSTLIRDTCRNGVYCGVPISIFQNYTIAVDATGWLCIIMASVHSNIVSGTNLANDKIDMNQVTDAWVLEVLRRTLDFLRLKIKPVFVIDGPPMAEKADTRDQRKQNRDNTASQIKSIEQAMENTNPEDISPNKTGRLATLLRASWRLGREHVELFKAIMLALGLPVLEANHDAEQLCSLLARDGHVAAVYSADSDTMAFGAPLVIKEIAGYVKNEQGLRVPACTVWNRQEIITDLGLSEESFIDLCILCGCDYNTRGDKPPVENISSKRAYQLIKTYNLIEYLPQIAPGWLNASAVKGLSTNKFYNLGLLKHLDCRRIFWPTNSLDCIRSGQLKFNHCDINQLQLLCNEHRIPAIINDLVGAKINLDQQLPLLAKLA